MKLPSMLKNLQLILSPALILGFILPTQCLSCSLSNQKFPDTTPQPPAHVLWLPLVSRTKEVKASNKTINNVEIVTKEIARYEKFEAHFDINTVASDPSLPFDPNPPAGLQPGIGVSVDGLFSSDNWQTTIVQPGFLFQPYSYSLENDRDHFIPNGAPRWAVRFAPQKAGNWSFRIRVQDASGTEYYPSLNQNALIFPVKETSSNPYTQKGFLRVSPNDPRYFEFEDGSTFTGVGFNDGFDQSAQVEQKMQTYEANKIDFLRVWLGGASINGSQWTSWASSYLPNDGYLPGVSFDTQNTYNNADVAFKLNSENPCLYSDFWQGGIPAEPNTTYKISARIKLNNVTGNTSSSDDGFVIKQAGWLEKNCTQANNGTLITMPKTGSSDWTTVQGTYTTGNDQYWLDNLYLALQNTSGGEVYIDEVKVWRADDPSQVNLLREPNANSHMYFDPMNSAKWDRFIESAEKHGVYLKLVVDEKNEWIRNHLGADGKITANGSNDNFYAAPNTKVRWLEQAWWRYIIARWGYSTAIHSFEYVNEGDPYDSQHYEAANAMAKYFHTNDPSHHMVTTSFWHSFPNAEFWSNQQYPDIDYADIHAYISTGWGLTATFISGSMLETNPSNIHSGNGSARISATASVSQEIVPRGLVLQGKGEWIVRYWMKAENFAANCPFNSSGGMQRVRWLVDGGNYSGGQEGIVPSNAEGKDFICTSPAGSYNWTQFNSDRDRDGNLLPASSRLIINDDLPHTITLLIENSNGSNGTAWIDDVELVSPEGKIVPVIGQFDNTPMDEDTAWYNAAYGELFGGASPVGARMPLVRGETGVDFPDNQNWNPDLLKDTQGIWLHNNVWGQINSGGMYDLFWWATETIPESIYSNYLTFSNFMQGIPLNNGDYQDAGATTSNTALRAWGQRDDVHGRMHLWIQNKQHTWKRIVNGTAINAVSGTITIPNVASGQYKVEWWHTYSTSNPIFLTQTLNSNGSLTLTLPEALMDDVAVKIERLP